LDDKEDGGKKFVLDAPKAHEYLTEEEKKQFDIVKKMLDKAKINYKVNENMVRGLDYYTNLVFEFIVDGYGTSIGGGRYSKLVKEIG
jgi:histidyl-tRNA synthetase